MLVVRLSSQGQLEIPETIRNALRLGPGSELLVTLEGGRVVLEPRRLKHGMRLGDWLPAMQVTPPSGKVDLDADVEGYTDDR